MVLGEYHTWKGSGHTRKLVKKTDTMMYVPILKTIAGLLKCDDVISEVTITQ